MKKGFTLIELLVVMAILGILATVGLSGSFYNSQKKGRDAQRKHDLGQIQKALEMYYNDKGRYRTFAENIPSGGSSWDESGTLYMKSVPADPKKGNYHYCYESDERGTYYRLYARLENEKDTAIDKSNCRSLSGDKKCVCACRGRSDYCYKVASPNAP